MDQLRLFDDLLQSQRYTKCMRLEEATGLYHEPGDLLLVERGILIHQVNCRGVFGAGLAKQIAEKWPGAKLHYLQQPKELGTVAIYKVNSNPLWLVHLFGQDRYGRDRCHTDYQAVRKGLTQLHDTWTQDRYSVCIPHKMGCGLGGGDWPTVCGIFREVFDNPRMTLPSVIVRIPCRILDGMP